MRTVIALLFLSAGFAAAQTKPPLEAAARKPYAVWWYPKLELAKLEDATARLAQPFSQEDLYELAGGAHDFGQPPQPEVHNCNELLAHIDPNKWDFDSLDRVGGWGDLGADCAVLKALAHAAPSRRSAVRNLAWTPAVLPFLPAGVWGADGAESHATAIKADMDGLSLSQYRRGAKAVLAEGRPNERTAVTLDTEASHTWYALTARGDFDGDGWEEIIVEVYGAANHSQRGSFSAYLLIRKSASDRFQIVKEIF